MVCAGVSRVFCAVMLMGKTRYVWGRKTTLSSSLPSSVLGEHMARTGGTNHCHTPSMERCPWGCMWGTGGCRCCRIPQESGGPSWKFETNSAAPDLCSETDLLVSHNDVVYELYANGVSFSNVAPHGAQPQSCPTSSGPLNLMPPGDGNGR